jgi:hypothetical protein
MAPTARMMFLAVLIVFLIEFQPAFARETKAFSAFSTYLLIE